MYKPITSNEQISFKNLYSFLSIVAIKYLRIVLFFVFMYVVYFFAIKDTKYTASVSFYTDYNDINSSASMSIIKTFQGDETGDLNFSIFNYLNSDKFLESTILHQYSVDGDKKTLIDIFSISGETSFFKPKTIIRDFSLIPDLSLNDKKLLITKQLVREGISFSEDRKTGLNTISFLTTISPDITKQIVEKIFNSILDYSNEVTSVKAREKVSFIEGRVDDITIKLELSENEMLTFVENNKNLNSPHLALKKNRIQRDISLYSQVLRTLSDQLEIAKIDERDNTSSIVVLDSSHFSPYKAGRSMFDNIFILAFGLYGIFSMIELYNNRKTLFA